MQDNPMPEQIISEATSLFYQYGYHGTSMRQIAEKVGIEAGSLYYYVPGKEALLMAVMSRVLNEMYERIHDPSSGLVFRDPLQNLRELIAIHVDYVVHHNEAVAVTYSEITKLSPENRIIIIGLRDRYENIFYEVVHYGIEKKSFLFPDEKIVVTFILSFLNRIPFWFHPEGRLSLEELIRLATTFIVGGLLMVKS
ncbi:MAG: hypothetical protein C7B46_13660 [Sulfobacillus benefaciens]|uniref:HTH tetR-type domain-containing protein n=1 Tax=Sulfobacillus benefaciens TaxID=453960 RepID=A0A2T2XDR0_9FIRM|nr:MAG: hypothetical protein C7B46_13660 [Sulfobacillus benefaciens]